MAAQTVGLLLKLLNPIGRQFDWTGPHRLARAAQLSEQKLGIHEEFSEGKRVSLAFLFALSSSRRLGSFARELPQLELVQVEGVFKGTPSLAPKGTL